MIDLFCTNGSSPPEAWKPVPGFDGYEVSDLGRVRSWWWSVGHRGMALADRPQRVLAPSLRRGYPAVTLSRGGQQYQYLVHRLVLETFTGSPPAGYTASHLNGIRTDNRATNLVWEPHQKNIARKREHGTMARGERHGRARLSSNDVRAIRARYAAGDVTQRALAQQFGVHQAQIHHIVTGVHWRHVAAHPQPAQQSAE
jgi:hypothetical protein